MKPGENKNEQLSTQLNEFGEQRPVAYAIFGINGRGVHYLRDVKKIPVDDVNGEWKSDDDGLGEYWSGNQALGFVVAPDGDVEWPGEPVEIPADMTEAQYWKRRAMASAAIARGLKRQLEEVRAAIPQQGEPVAVHQPSAWTRRAQAAVDAMVGEKDGRKLDVLQGRMEQLLREALEASSLLSDARQVTVAWQNTGDPTWIKVGGAAPDDTNWRALVYADADDAAQNRDSTRHALVTSSTADSPSVRAAVRRTLQHHKLTQHGDGVVEADLAHAVIGAALAQH